jgi:HK97 family phage major capsid protein
MTFGLESQLTDLTARRDTLRYQTQRALEAAERAGRSEMLAAERQACSDIEVLEQRIAEISADIERAGTPKIADLQRRAAARNNTRTTTPGSTMNRTSDFHLTYRRNDVSTSWVRDLMRHTLNMDSDGESRGRLMSHAREVAEDSAYTEFRDLNRVDGTGGYAVPPAWLMNQYIELARSGRAFANLCQRQPLPGGTDSINIPKVLTGTTVGIQTADNTAVSETDLTDTFVNAPVRTIAGQQGVSIQLIDQSPIAFDDVIFRDLVAAHAAVLDQQCLDGTGTSGQVLGVDYTPGITTITVSSLDVPGIYKAIANAIQLIHTHRFLPPEVIVMHPRRFGWLLSLLDTTNRPLFIPNANGPMNVVGIEDVPIGSQQVVGTMAGLPIVTDPNISTTSGPYTGVGSGDLIYVTRASDLLLWEGGIRARVLPEVRATNLTVLLQIFNYFAFSAARYPASTVVIDGLAAPTF